MGARRLLGARHLGSLLSGCGGRETEEQDAGREDGDELLPGQCGARAALAWRAEFAPSKGQARVAGSLRRTECKDGSGSGSGRVSAGFRVSGSVFYFYLRICGFGYPKYFGFGADF
jgi:hypothetical protein